MKCVVSTTTRPSRWLRITFQVKRREYGSMPEVGSSRKTMRLPPMKAMPTDSLRFCPPDSVLENALRFSCTQAVGSDRGLDRGLDGT